MSELLKKHLQKTDVNSNLQNASQALVAPGQNLYKPQSAPVQNVNQNTTVQQMPGFNVKDANVNGPDSDSFALKDSNDKQIASDAKKNKNAQVAAVSLGVTMFVTAATLFGATKGGKGIFKKTVSKINSSINKGLHNLYQSHKSEKLDKAIENYYSMRSQLDFNGVMANTINGKDVLQRGVVEKLKGKDINIQNAGSFKKKAVEIYQNIADKVFGLYNRYDTATKGLYVRKGAGNLSGLYSRAKNAITKSNDDVLTALSNLKNSPKANETIMYKGKKVKIKDIIPDIEEMTKRRRENFDAFFTDDLIKQRYSAWDDFFMKDKDGKSLTEKTQKVFIERIKGKKFKELLSDSIADGLIRDEKIKRAAIVRGNKNKISNTLGSVLEENRDAVADVRKLIQHDDINSLHKLDEILKSIDKLKKTTFADAISSKEAQKTICSTIEELKKSIVKGAKKNGAGSADAIKALDDIKASLKNIKSGDTENMMEILEQVLEPETYEKMIKPGLIRSQKALNKACSMEMYDTVDKLRDINCGSAATDFMTAIMSTILLGIYTAQAENNDERVSVGLTTGLPIMSTVGTNLFGAINQISGGKSMAFSLGTGFVTKFICDGLNKIYRNSKGLDDKAKPSVATIDDYIDPYKNKIENVLKMPQNS